MAARNTEKKSDKKIQDAHEAIRPSDVTRTPAAIKDSLTRDQFRLYQLIWKRFVASRMQPAKYETTSVKSERQNIYLRFLHLSLRLRDSVRCIQKRMKRKRKEMYCSVD